jgi:cold shock protein
MIVMLARHRYIGAVRDCACPLQFRLNGPPQDTQNLGYESSCEIVRIGCNDAFARFYKEALMATGTVKFFNAQKGFGFIVQDGGGPDVFVHISAVERAGMQNLNEGQRLSFDVQADRRSGKSAAENLQAA